jgi:hypothetical protein
MRKDILIDKNYYNATETRLGGARLGVRRAMPHALSSLDDILDPQLREHGQMQNETQKAALQSLADSVFIHAGDMDANDDDDDADSIPTLLHKWTTSIPLWLITIPQQNLRPSPAGHT